MIPKNKYWAGVLLAGLSCASLFGQEKRPGDRLVAPRWQFSTTSMMQPGERTGRGVIAQKGDGYSYKAMQLKQAFRVPAISSYFNASDGVLQTSIQLLPNTEAAFHVEFAKENTVQAPPQVVLEAKSTGVIEYRLHNCQVLLIEWPKRR
ncbi:MAG TPA: hypothetical protein VKB47_07650 [Terracidiphilus sp.]|nr:hypothetical protein [Terracidiphilus sp.]